MSQAETPITTTAPGARASRRSLFGGLTAVIVGSGITAGFAASVADLVPSNPDAELLALRPRLNIAVRDVGYSEMSNGSPGMSNEDWVEQTAQALEDTCWAIIKSPAAKTDEGRGLKAAAAMHNLKAAYCHGSWPGEGEVQAWRVLSEIAGGVYVPCEVPERIRHLEPARA